MDREDINPQDWCWGGDPKPVAHLSVTMNDETQQLISKLEDTLTDMGLFDENCDNKGRILYLNDDKLELELQLRTMDTMAKTINDYECDVYENEEKITDIVFDKHTFFNAEYNYQLGLRVVIDVTRWEHIGETRLVVTRLKIDSKI